LKFRLHRIALLALFINPGLIAGNPHRSPVIKLEDGRIKGPGAASLQGMLRRTRVLGVGEAMHGSAAFQSVQFALFRQGIPFNYRVLAMENGAAPCWTMNQFILGHATEEELRHAVAISNRCCQSQAFVDFLRWMRAWNLDHPHDGGLMIVGLDPTYPRQVIDLLVRAAKVAVPASASELESDYATYYPHAVPWWEQKPLYASLPEEEHERCREALQAADAWLNAHRAQLESAYGDQAAALLLLSNRTIIQSEKQFGRDRTMDPQASAQERDEDMAEGVRWIMSHVYPSARMLIAAHNAHLSKTAWDARPGQPHSMGFFLAQAYGGSYRAIAQSSYRGAYSLINRHRSAPSIQMIGFQAPPESIEGKLHALYAQSVFLDFQANHRNGKSWENEKTQIMGYAGGGSAPPTYIPYDLSKAFDGLVSLEESPGYAYSASLLGAEKTQ